MPRLRNAGTGSADTTPFPCGFRERALPRVDACVQVKGEGCPMTTMRVRTTTSRFTRGMVFATVLVLAGSVLARTAVAASASTISLLPNCGVRASAPTFAPWGDPNPYFPIANGGFESGPAGWNLAGGAAVESGNETFFVAEPTDAHSLAIPAGGRATSPATCIAMGENSFRLFVKSAGTGQSSLHVQAFVQNAL